MTQTRITNQMTVQIFDSHARSTVVIKAEDHLGHGAIGDVYDLERIGMPGQCAKIYRTLRPEAKAKVIAMLQRPPRKVNTRLAGLDHVQFAWPTAMLESVKGEFIGYVMPRIDYKSTVSLTPYLVPREAARVLTAEQRSLNVRLKLARNIAALMADLHAQGHAFVDFKDQNIRVYPTPALAAFLDTDGYRIESLGGQVFPGRETSPTFNSPESAGGARSNLDKHHDDFVLASVLFQLLNFGIHPFQGIPNLSGSSPNVSDLDGNVKLQVYPYGLKKRGDLSPKAESIHECWDSKTQAMFEQTFLAAQAQNRISARQWQLHFDDLVANAMVPCVAFPRDIEHVHFRGRVCHRCRANSLQPPPQPPPIVGGTTMIGWPSPNPPQSPPAPAQAGGWLAKLTVWGIYILVAAAIKVVLVFISK